jgi:hypothetical protein
VHTLPPSDENTLSTINNVSKNFIPEAGNVFGNQNAHFEQIIEREVEELDDVIEDDGSEANHFDEQADKTYAEAKKRLNQLSRRVPRDIVSASSGAMSRL